MENNLAHSVCSGSQVGIESPQGLMEMFYEGVLCFCVRAKHAVRNEDIEQRVYFTKRVMAVFMELTNSLNYGKGGGAAFYLAGLYAREIQLLSLTSLENSREKIDEVTNMAKGFLKA